ncbi:MAG: O-antigen ligase family protein [Acidobacteriota bacterium]|nr:O-antigen ligase family protein [Acidobacteriota bacterium]
MGGHFALALISAGLGYAVWMKGGVWPRDWAVASILVGAGALELAMSRGPLQNPAAPDRWLRVLLSLFVGYVLLQLLPLPQGLLALLSPERGAQVSALRQVTPVGFAPLTVFAPATLAYLFRILGYVAVLLAMRELTFRWKERCWVVVTPLLAIGVIEAAIGLAQVAAEWPNGMARGTYVDRDHFAGLLEMILPLAVMYALAAWLRADTRHKSPAMPALAAAGLGSAAGLMLLGIIYSLSRMGFVVALFALFAIGLLAAGQRLRSARVRWVALGVLAGLVALAFVLLPPDQLIVRFADLASSDRVAGDTRLHFWKETLSLIGAYPWFGCGLGGYESAFRQFQITLPMMSVDFAHNDYLQALAELGIIGGAILAALLIAIAARAVSGSLRQDTVDSRFLAIGCVGSILAMLLHSIVDFNMQIPANALVMSWIAGVALGLWREPQRVA